MKLIIPACLALLLSGCQGSGTGNSAGITYTMVGNLNIGPAAAAADTHCMKYGKVAQLHEARKLIASFRCVAP